MTNEQYDQLVKDSLDELDHIPHEITFYIVYAQKKCWIEYVFIVFMLYYFAYFIGINVLFIDNNMNYVHTVLCITYIV